MTEPVSRSRHHPGLKGLIAEALGPSLVTIAGRTIWPESVNQRLSVLIYHRVLKTADPLQPDEITVGEFQDEMRILATRFNVLPLSEGIARLQDGDLPPFAVCITFDDGYRDNFTTALPVLQQYGLSATFFIATGYVDGGQMWNDTLLEVVRGWPNTPIDLSDWGVRPFPMDRFSHRQLAFQTLLKWMRRIGDRGRGEMLDRLKSQLRKPLQNDLMMTRLQLQKMSASGMEVGCHTVSHPILARIDDQAVFDEIERSRSYLEELTQQPCRFFAYPNGVPGEDFSPAHVDIVRRLGFEAAFTTVWGAATQTTNLFEVPRFTPWDKTASAFAFRLILSRRNKEYRRVA
jgi:peptidoglycan/xylan/chitin deacetylase (PgdA/CDA1 family)